MPIDSSPRVIREWFFDGPGSGYEAVETGTEDEKDSEDTKNESDKTCRVCGKGVRQGEGTYYRGILVHKKGCKGLAKRYYRRFRESKKGDME